MRYVFVFVKLVEVGVVCLRRAVLVSVAINARIYP